MAIKANNDIQGKLYTCLWRHKFFPIYVIFILLKIKFKSPVSKYNPRRPLLLLLSPLALPLFYSWLLWLL